MAGSSNKMQLDDKDIQDIWGLVSKSTREFPHRQPNPRQESISMPTPVEEDDEDFSPEGIMDIVGTLLSGPRAGPCCCYRGRS